MVEYVFDYKLRLKFQLQTDDVELVRKIEKETGKAVTYENLQAELTKELKEGFEDIFSDGVTFELEPVVHSNVDTCVSCGEIIPEGRQVCPKCEK